MNRYILSLFSLFSLCYLLISCEKENGDWLHGTNQEKMIQIEEQFRGFDLAMIEVSYRYQELYFAGVNQNWDLAIYQCDKIKLSIEKATIRRPKRSESANFFLDQPWKKMRSSLDLRDSLQFQSAFTEFTHACNACHQRENLGFFRVRIPEVTRQ